jgi:hypothetical protein
MFHCEKDYVKEGIEAFTGRKISSIQPYICAFDADGINISSQDINVIFFGKVTYNAIIPAGVAINAATFYVKPDGTSTYVWHCRETAGALQESFLVNLETVLFTSLRPDIGSGTFSGYRITCK